MFNKIKYRNVCWYCKCEISSERNVRCSLCGWFICSECSACDQNSCVGTFFNKKKARELARESYAALPENEQVGVLHWFRLNKQSIYDEIKRIEEAQEQEKIRLQRERRLAADAEIKAKQLAHIEALKKHALFYGVYHYTYGLGDVIEFYLDGQFEYVRVMFKTCEKSFVFPDAFERGFLVL